MKRAFVIFILSFYLLSLTELSQLMKLPALIDHYVEHKEKDNSLSLIDFLAMHYAATSDNDGDSDKDAKLPFKSHDGCLNTGGIAFIPATFESFSVEHVYSEARSYQVHNEEFLTSAYLSSIWQPPKSC